MPSFAMMSVGWASSPSRGLRKSVEASPLGDVGIGGMMARAGNVCVTIGDAAVGNKSSEGPGITTDTVVVGGEEGAARGVDASRREEEGGVLEEIQVEDGKEEEGREEEEEAGVGMAIGSGAMDEGSVGATRRTCSAVGIAAGIEGGMSIGAIAGVWVDTSAKYRRKNEHRSFASSSVCASPIMRTMRSVLLFRRWTHHSGTSI